ncbi:hypothetical protein IE81DRAFT_320084 [Ceraceosorus guamensis]|uniref:CAP-Gly domain-containing protein n=1 Tax=Ceraceosorus guamensis TaxID=1522189 RepID=A0A316W5W3_9BASI|nr:hypothetical protein IE81DRAFT_320084 [Ceraceosorus guamensis]PWN45350.1 hypothetical protein IE81DRAFT_320084 [Ceraceosorus guamensis]
MSTVNLFLHVPSASILSERRLPSDVPLDALRIRLEQISGIPPSCQSLSLHRSRTDESPISSDTLIIRLPEYGAQEAAAAAAAAASSEAEASLEKFGARDGMGLKVEDVRPYAVAARFHNESLEGVDKFEMDDETYKARQDSVLAFKQRNKLGRFDPSKAQTQTNADASRADLAALSSDLRVGARCQVQLGSRARRGSIRYVGKTQFASGIWIGLQYDEPVGKNDGSVQGERYFDCKALFGGFVRPEKVQVGDFPEEDIEAELQDEEEM